MGAGFTVAAEHLLKAYLATLHPALIAEARFGVLLLEFLVLAELVGERLGCAVLGFHSGLEELFEVDELVGEVPALDIGKSPGSTCDGRSKSYRYTCQPTELAATSLSLKFPRDLGHVIVMPRGRLDAAAWSG
ncbi:hypothetical protein [Streptomyces sp. NPDC058291]|uniref:hypothetical protein n=1 Tax=Streptomyces sp. NPDC058291 TaxID=3346427 RepID=UPI0036F13E1D